MQQRVGVWRSRHLGAVRPVLAMTVAGMLLALALALLPGRARANGVPTLVSLGYLDDLSNWGPADASGELELSFAEGYARLTAEGLPALDGQRYQGWLVNSESNDAISIGRFDADANGRISYEGTLPPISDFGFDLFLVTVEPEPDNAPQPSASRSIGGRFSLLGPAPVDATSAADTGTGAVAGAGNGAAGALPAELPNTGAPPLLNDVARTSALVGIMALSLFIGVRLGRRHA